MGVIFDLDQTIIDTSIAFQARRERDWAKAYDLIPSMKPYGKVVDLIKKLVSQGVEVAIVTSSPSTYCEKILSFLEITGVITVCYHDTAQHKPDPEPILLAINKMRNQQGKKIIAIGDEENDIIAANRAGCMSILAYWANPATYWNWKGQFNPTVFCRDEESLLHYFNLTGINLDMEKLIKRNRNTYQLFDYYPISKVHDMQSEELFTEVKNKNAQHIFCDMFCSAVRESIKHIKPNTYGIFVVPSSKAGKWNEKLTNYVVPKLVQNMGFIDCSRYIVRHTERDKQAFGGDRSVESNLSTLELQYSLPKNMKGAFIIDDITTSGNSFEACKQIICKEGILKDNIYCAAIGGTI